MNEGFSRDGKSIPGVGLVPVVGKARLRAIGRQILVIGFLGEYLFAHSRAIPVGPSSPSYHERFTSRGR